MDQPLAPATVASGILPAHLSLLGVPLERGAGLRGTLMGPQALRVAGLPEALTRLGFTVADHGDLACPAWGGIDLSAHPGLQSCRHAAEIAAWTRLIHDHAYRLAGEATRPIFLGGDHSLSMGSISGIARHCREAGRELAVLWLDAHGDFNTPATSPSGNIHGMALAFLTGEPELAPLLDRALVPLDPSRVHLVGLRAVDPQERRRLALHGLDCVDMRMIDETSLSAVMRRVLGGLAGRDVHLHVSLDTDFLDPDLAPGVGTAVPGGVTYREAHRAMEMLYDSGLVASLDVVELNPFLDDRGRSARLLVELVASLFGRAILERGSV